MPKNNLKTNCKTWRFDQIAINVNERVDDPSKAGVDYYVGLEHLDPDSLKIRRWGKPDDVEATKLCFKRGDIIFGRRRAYQRKLGVAEFDGICSAHAMVLRPRTDVVLPEFLPFFMQSDLFMNRAEEISVGSLSPTINWKTLAVQQFALPSMEEQYRIANVLLAIDEVREAAVETIVKARELKNSIFDSELPIIDGSMAKWPIVRFGDYVEVIDPNPSHRYPQYVTDGVPLVATQNFVDDDDYSFNKCMMVPIETFTEQEKRCRFSDGDVVFARKGILGFARKYGSERKAFSHTIVILKPRKNDISAEYLLWYARSNAFMTSLKKAMNSNSGVPTLGIKTIENVPMWLPDKAQQLRIAGILQRVHGVVIAQRSRINTAFQLKTAVNRKLS